MAVSYSLEHSGEYSFHLGAYDPAFPLVIDPAVLVYCGYIGGSDDDEGQGIAVDSAGNAFVTGDTASTETTFPETVGPDLSYNGSYGDAFVAKVKADGTGLVYAGYIGGSGSEGGSRIAVDPAGNAYIVGTTNSTEATFPVTVGPDLTYNVADSEGNTYITGLTGSTEETFPETVGPDLTYNGADSHGDAFVAKVLFFAPAASVYLPLVVRNH